MMMNKAETYNSQTIDELFDSISPDEAERIEKKMLLAAKIEDAMKARGLKNKELAKVLKKHPSEITKWLSGTHNFTTDTLWDIERVLGIELITIEEKTKEQIISCQISINKNVGTEYPADYDRYLRENQLSEAVISKNLGISHNAFSVLKSRLHGRIQEYLLGKLSVPKYDSAHIIYTNKPMSSIQGYA